ncbi:MAG: D-amino acid aminotransferase [Gammaproteobacteria bacterium]|nr:D-amino acid aminotransferase [Gammaproteobacteria bacterium]
MAQDSLAYLDGTFLPLAEACVPALDRGFLFGDAVYEVIPAYGGRLFRLEEHLARLGHSLDETRIPQPLTREAWQEVLSTLVARNGGGDLSVYLQVTRGVTPRRDHAFGPELTPTVFAMTSALEPPPAGAREQGVAAVTCDDIRWRRCDIKATTLLANVLLRQQAVDAQAQEAILVRDGQAVEGAASNLFIVRAGVLATPPKGPALLPGITRDLLLELAEAEGMPFEERAIPAATLAEAEEIWLTSSTKEILPVTRLDGRIVGTGRPGPAWRRMFAWFQNYKARLRRGEPDRAARG